MYNGLVRTVKICILIFSVRTVFSHTMVFSRRCYIFNFQLAFNMSRNAELERGFCIVMCNYVKNNVIVFIGCNQLINREMAWTYYLAHCLKSCFQMKIQLNYFRMSYFFPSIFGHIFEKILRLIP